jgi:serine protease Do
MPVTTIILVAASDAPENCSVRDQVPKTGSKNEDSNSMKSLFKRLRERRLASAFVILAALSAAIVGFSYAAHGVSGQEKQSASADATPLKVVNSPVAPNEFVKIAKSVGPAVVNINTQTLPKQSTNRNPRKPQRRAQPQNPDDDDQDNGDNGGDQGGIPDFFYKFFGGQGQGQDGDDDGQVHESLGSGFIVDPKGYIITNNHVIEKADKIYVKLSTDPDTQDLGRPARIIGVDKATDLAVIKIDVNSALPTVKMGNSDSTQVGDWVEAIGSPFALSQTVTAGIISAENRTIEPGQAGQFQHFIQTDAAINPGNSGGPLLNMNGEVIGVNTAIYTQSAGYQGIGFALPSNTVVEIYNDLIGPSHKVVRGSIGISFRMDLSGAVNRVYGFKNGVIVQYVQPGGPADKAGIKPRDIIVTIDGRPIKDGDDLVNDIAGRRPGSSARLGYIRDGQQGNFTVVIGDRDRVFAEQAAAQQGPAPDDSANPGESKLGVSVREISPETANRIHSSGVLVQSVRPGSFADLHGLDSGLVIVRINKQPAGTRDQFNAVVGKLKSGDDVVFEVVDPRHLEEGINLIGGTL